MNTLLVFSVFLLFCVEIGEAAPFPVEHIVVLMEENRSFDHLLGWLNRINPEIDGLTGKEYNPMNTKDPNGPRIYVNDTSPYIAPFDPDHSVPGTTEEIFGTTLTPYPDPAPMSGFVAKACCNLTNQESVLNMFPPERVPAISTLATEFAVFDHWFAAVPGPTHPNRLFAHSATSHGSTDNSVPKDGWPQDIIYDRITKQGLTWKMYYYDTPWALMLGKLRTKENMARIQYFDQFFLDAEMGNLPNYTFLEPRYFLDKGNGQPAQDQHPDHSVAVGDQLMKTVYEALRNGPLWEKTLFIITYDEHGGFYDHVPTPQKDVPAPDDFRPKPPMPPFNFDRLGIRIPCVMVSPWIDRGTVVHEQYELSSIPATVKKVFGIPEFLTKRDAWANTFENVVMNRTTPRKDCPTTIPAAKMDDKEMKEHVQQEGERQVNDLQKSYLRLIQDIMGEKEDVESMNQSRGGEVARTLTARYIQKMVGSKLSAQ